MTMLIKRIVARKKGSSEALIAVLIALVGFFLVSTLKDIGGTSSQAAASQGSSLLGSLGSGLGGKIGTKIGGFFGL